MTSLPSRHARLLALALSAGLAVAACSSGGEDGADPLAEDDAGTEPEEGGTLLPPSTLPDAGGRADASAPKDAGAKDASKEAAASDAAAPPAPGTPCATVDEIFVRACGACGEEQALCVAHEDGGPGGTVTEYSPCTGELEGGCIPGTTEDEACGNCGTRARTCNKYCAWTTGQCKGEPAESCTPTAHDYTTAGCPALGVFRQRACSDACTWAPLSSCEPLAFSLTVASDPGATTSAIYPLRALVSAERITGTCGSNTFSTTKNHPYVFVELVNPTSTTVTASAWNALAPNGGASISTVMTVYAGSARPIDVAARKGCVKAVTTTCPSGIACGYTGFAGLAGANAFTIPPSGSVTLFFQSYYAPGGTQPAEGDVRLVVRTDAVQ